MITNREKYGITDEEFEIMSLIGEGNTRKEIAELLKISKYYITKTVESVKTKTKTDKTITAISALLRKSQRK